MFKSIQHRILTRFLTNRSQLCKRSFLSESFKCTEAWDNRLKSPVLRNLQFGNLYNGLMNSFATGQRINVLDIDLFANGITKEFFHKELEEILLKLREIPETTLMYESTAHAVVRWYLSRNDKAELLNILAQRLTFGIFPDIYLLTLMIGTFLKEGDSISATKVAVLQMLQEDCNHPILRSLSLYSCLKYLESSNVWETPVEDKDDEDEEIVKVRVHFLRNEYFDDHFDIVNTNHLVGKTMVAFGKALGGPVGFSNQLIGWVLYEKYEEAEHLLNHIIENKLPIYKEVTEIVSSYLKKTPKQLLADKTEEDGKSDGNLQSKNNVETLLKNLNCQILIDGNLLQAVEEVIRNEIKEHEESIIHKQCETYKQWEKERMENIENSIIEEKKKSARINIENIKKELEEEELKLFFFDNEDAYDDTIKQNMIEKANVKYYRSKESFSNAGTNYIPPEVSQKPSKI